MFTNQTDNKFRVPTKRIGLLAGAGRFPVVFAQAARRQGHEVVTVGPTGMAVDLRNTGITTLVRELSESAHLEAAE